MKPVLARIGELPPPLTDRIGFESPLIGFEVIADVFVVTEEHIPADEDREVADAALSAHRLDLGPHVGVQLQVFGALLGMQSAHHAEPAHGRHPFVDPAVSPVTRKRCENKNTINTGATETSVAKANSGRVIVSAAALVGLKAGVLESKTARPT